MLAGIAGLVVAALSAWLVWYVLVLQKVASSSLPWGPKWLAVAVSGAIFRFGKWYLRYSDNLAEHAAAGYWKDGQQHVMAWHPHGAFAIAALCFTSHYWADDFPTGRRGAQFVCVASLLLRVPFLADYLLLCHARSQDRKSNRGVSMSRSKLMIRRRDFTSLQIWDSSGWPSNMECHFFRCIALARTNSSGQPNG